jgi:polysaccharide pyruvyl transferase WcaK-like protein
MKSKKISFFGLFGQQNIGNDCTLQAILDNLPRYLPDAEVLCICSGQKEVSARHKIPTFPMRPAQPNARPRRNNLFVKLVRKVFIKIPKELLHWVGAFKTLIGTDMFIVPGTGFLVDHSTGPYGYPYYVFKWSVIAKLCRNKLLFVSIGAGPIYHPLSKWFIRKALSMADYRSYRDDFSKQYLDNIGFDTKDDHVYPDLAFSLPMATMPDPGEHGRQRPVVGIGIIDYQGPSNTQLRGGGETFHRDYIEKVGDFIAWFIENNYTVRILIGDARYDSSVKQDLMELLEKRRLKYTDGQIIDEPILTIEQLLPQLAETDVVISPRFHNIILALMLNKPVISISYNEKFDFLMSGVGLPEYCQHIDHFDADKLTELFKELEKNTGSLKPQIKKKTEEYRMALDEQYSFIFNNV